MLGGDVTISLGSRWMELLRFKRSQEIHGGSLRRRECGKAPSNEGQDLQPRRRRAPRSRRRQLREGPSHRPLQCGIKESDPNHFKESIQNEHQFRY